MEQFNYLYMAAISLPNETQSQKVLKSFYLTKSKELFGYDRSSRNLKFNPTRTCNRCNSLWADGGCQIAFKERVKKGKLKNRRKCRQIVNKHYKFGMPSGRFTRLAKSMARKVCRQVIFQCNLCANKQVFYLRPKLRNRKIVEKKNKKKGSMRDEAQINNNKKKRNRTKFAGLDRSVMEQIKNPTKKVQEVTKKNEKKQKKAPGKVIKPKESAGPSKKSLSKSSMMQLAQLLKNKDSSSSVNRLDMMMK